MIYTSIFLLRAINELLDAWEWYEDRQIGLGDRFSIDIGKMVSEIEQHPERYSNKHGNYYEARIKSFPYLIVYRINKKQEKITIVSVFHTSRNPSKKYKLK